MNYYIADTHFFHENVMGYDARPFLIPEENNRAIIDNWNEVVGIEDTVYVLGDFSWSNSTKAIEILKELNGSKVLIRGNHDFKLLKNPKFREQFIEITDYKEITNDDGSGIVLCHYPIVAFRNHYRGKWAHLYGHTHNTWEQELIEQTRKKSIDISGKPLNMVNVGVMMPWMNYYPRTLTEIIDGYNQYQEDKYKIIINGSADKMMGGE